MIARPHGAAAGTATPKTLPGSRPVYRPTTTVIYSGSFLCAMAYLLVEYARPQSWIPALGYIRPGVLAMGVGMLAVLLHGSLPKDRLSRLMLTFVGLMAVLVPFAVNRNRAFWQTWSMALMLFGGLLPIILFTDTFARFQRLLRFWNLVNVSLAAYAIGHSGQGIGSFLSDENDLALAMNAAVPYGVALLILERGLVLRAAALLATTLTAFASIATLSRGGFIGLTCVALTVWAQSKRKVLSLVVLVAFGAAVAALAPEKFWRDMATLSTSNEKGDTGYQRLYSWKVGWRIFLDYPIAGVGPNNYPYRAHEYEDETSDEIGYHLWGRAAHSLYFTLLPELGSLGTGLFVAMIWYGARGRHRVRKKCRALLTDSNSTGDDREQARWVWQAAVCIDASLIGFLVSAIFLSVLYYPHFWVLTAFTTVLMRIGDDLGVGAQPAPDAAQARALTTRPGRLAPALTWQPRQPSARWPSQSPATSRTRLEAIPKS